MASHREEVSLPVNKIPLPRGLFEEALYCLSPILNWRNTGSEQGVLSASLLGHFKWYGWPLQVRGNVALAWLATSNAKLMILAWLRGNMVLAGFAMSNAEIK